ncbi:AAA family ATPase [Alterinioella nitratireducens]|uniref:AAA family ATPase n=1 Tax=Alterinioella nitratireducens TaxID=2735915 RepID=UPI000C52B657|nr:AAA family ATPase [Alterinioella nitratireducens]MAX74896.1 pilus assembly protein CpaE [Nioella sp.]NPD19507.1 AAA family ATPase [Alterinioella nitratireducens]
MSGGLALQSNPAPIVACTIARDVQIFDLLIDDIEAELGEAWGDLSFLEAQTFLNQPDAETLEFVAIAIDDEDEPEIELVCSIIRLAKSKDIKVMLIAEDVSPAALHKLLQSGTDDFVPYPLPERAFHDSLARIRSNTPAPAEIGDHVSEGAESIQPTTTDIKDHVLFAVQSMAGGTGATTLAVNLAWELANIDKKLSPSVCLLDLDLQFGSTSTYLDLPRREVIYEVLSDAQTMDVDAFKQALLSFNQRLSVFTAPSDILPLDIIGQEEVKALLRLARETFDVVVVDMPSTIVGWSETVMNEADVYFATLELDMRSAQNTMRFIKALQAEGLPTDKLHYVLNRAPRNLDLSGKGRVKRLAESLDIELKTQLPDGTKQVSQACDHGVPLADMARKNPLRKEILKLAKTLHEAIAVQAVAR